MTATAYRARGVEMTVSKRTRFEVLRRDNHTCRYCGGTAPDIVLTMDHVLPVALGGSDDPTNLVTACRDCNAGKTSTSPSESIVADVSADAIRWAQARRSAAEKMLVQRADERELVKPFLKNWTYWDGSCTYLPNDWEVSVHSWLKHGMPMEILIDATDSAFGRPTVESRYVFRYMAGIVRNKMADLDEATKAEIEASGGA